MLQPGVRLIERPGVLHFFDGRRVVSLHGDATSREAIKAAVDVAGGDDSGEAVADARALLERLRLVVDTAAPFSAAAGYVSATTAGWHEPGTVAARLAEHEVHVLADPSFVELVSRSGLRAQHLASPAAVAALDPAHSSVVAAARPGACLEPLAEVNAACLAAGITWLPVGGFDGARLHVGPLVVPGQSACLACAQRRLAANVGYSHEFPDVVSAAAAPAPAALTSWAHALAALVLLGWVGARDVRLPGRLYTLAADSLELRQALVHRVPRCEACGAPDYLTAAAPWEVAGDD